MTKDQMLEKVREHYSEMIAAQAVAMARNGHDPEVVDAVVAYNVRIVGEGLAAAEAWADELFADVALRCAEPAGRA